MYSDLFLQYVAHSKTALWSTGWETELRCKQCNSA